GRRRRSWWGRWQQCPPAPAGAYDVEASWPVFPRFCKECCAHAAAARPAARPFPGQGVRPRHLAEVGGRLAPGRASCPRPKSPPGGVTEILPDLIAVSSFPEPSVFSSKASPL